MVAGKNETQRSVQRKGFNRVPGAADHLWYQYRVNGRKVAELKFSHGADEDLTPFLLGKLGKQCHLSRDEFYAFAKCWMTEKQYRQILFREGFITEEESMAQ
jgi:hypothetical protein